MTNADKLAAAIREIGSPQLQSDVAWKLDVRDRPATPEFVADAFIDVAADAAANEETKLVRNCDDVLIRAGFYLPVPAGTEIVTAGRDRSPTRKGVKFEPAASLEEWIGLPCNPETTA